MTYIFFYIIYIKWINIYININYIKNFIIYNRIRLYENDQLCDSSNDESYTMENKNIKDKYIWLMNEINIKIVKLIIYI